MSHDSGTGARGARSLLALALAGTLGALMLASAAVPALAQGYPGGYEGRGGYYGNRDYRGGGFQGTVIYFNRFDLRLSTGNGREQDVQLHQGTVINPTGTTLQNGMVVAVRGYRGPNGVINADEIDVVPGNGYGGNGGYGYGNGQYHRHHRDNDNDNDNDRDRR